MKLGYHCGPDLGVVGFLLGLAIDDARALDERLRLRILVHRISVQGMIMQKLSDSERRDWYKMLRGREDEIKAWEECAKREGINFATWARHWLNFAITHEAWLRENNMWPQAQA